MLVRLASALFLMSAFPAQAMTVQVQKAQPNVPVAHASAQQADPLALLKDKALEQPAAFFHEMNANGVTLMGNLGETSFEEMLDIAPTHSIPETELRQIID